MTVSETKNFHVRHICATYDGANQYTAYLQCKVIAAYVKLQRTNKASKGWLLYMCEVVIIGRRLICKYRTISALHVQLLAVEGFILNYA